MGTLRSLLSPIGNAVREVASDIKDVFTSDSDDTQQDYSQEEETSVSESKTAGAAETSATTPANKLAKSFDWRARLRPKDGGKSLFYGPNAESILNLIKQSNGLIWQYTPSISYTASVTYHQAQMQGMNYSINTYNKSSVAAFTVDSEFTANDIYEAQYMLAAITFLKICTKSYFGDIAAAQGRYGTPPPVMLFEYMGDQMFNKVPVVVTDYSFQFSDDVDYVPVEWDDTITYMPTVSRVSITLLPTYNPTKLRTKFDIEKIKSGEAYKHGFI